MPINPAALNRHLKAQIAHYPVKYRFNGIEHDGSWLAARVILDPTDGGVVDEGGGTLVVSKDDFGGVNGVFPTFDEDIDIRQADLVTWNTYKIAATTGQEDPLTTQLNIMVEPAGKA